jgi:hypothetical protein
METTDRFTRQRRLREVGEAGQARISQACFEIPSGESSGITCLYLQRAGAVRVDVVETREPEPFAHAAVFRHKAAGAMARGAWDALIRLRQTLGLDAT